MKHLDCRRLHRNGRCNECIERNCSCGLLLCSQRESGTSPWGNLELLCLRKFTEKICRRARQYQRETEETHREEQYYLCSIEPLAELFAIAVRKHWNIKNNLYWTLHVVFKENSFGSKEKKEVYNLGSIRWFVLFIIQLIKTYYGRSMRRVQKTIGRKPETKLPLIFAVLRVLYTNELLDSIHELAK